MPTINGRRTIPQQRAGVSPSLLDTLARRATALGLSYSNIQKQQDDITSRLAVIEGSISATPESFSVDVIELVSETKVLIHKVQRDLSEVIHVTANVERGLQGIGIETVEQLANSDVDTLSEGIKGVGLKKAEAMIADAQALIAEE